MRGVWIVALILFAGCESAAPLARDDARVAADGGVSNADASAAEDAEPARDAEPIADAGVVNDAEPRSFSLNDVSILLPLPIAGQPRSNFLWLMPRDPSETGPYFPVHRVSELPNLNADLPSDLGYPSAMIVGVRYDPCFRVAIGGPCEAQLRLIAQPVPYDGATDPFLLDDSAAHLFYRLESDEARVVEEALLALSQSSTISTAGPLSVHPIARGGGLGGEFGEKLRTLIAGHCRADNFLRLTANTFAMDNWGFSRLDWQNDHFVRAELQHLREPSNVQSWLRQAFREDLEDPAGTIVSDGVNSISYLFDRAHYPAMDVAARDAAIALVLQSQNPLRHTAESVDCVSCHLGSQIQTYAERHGVDLDGHDDAYVAPPGIDIQLVEAPEMRGNLGATIMFGWHIQTNGNRAFPSIGRRVIHESAEVVRALNGR